MKKPLVTLLAVVCLMAGCSKTQVNIDPREASDSILQNVTFRDTLVLAPDEAAVEWYDLDDWVEGFAIYISGSGATAEEIAVIKTGNTQTARATVEKRVEDLKYRFEDYVPAEMTKLSDPVIMEKGDVVILIIADDSAEAQKAADALFE